MVFYFTLYRVRFRIFNILRSQKLLGIDTDGEINQIYFSNMDFFGKGDPTTSYNLVKQLNLQVI